MPLSRQRFVWSCLIAVLSAGCEDENLPKATQSEPERQLIRSEPPPEPPPAPPRNFWQEQLLEEPQAEWPAPRVALEWYDDVQLASAAAEREQRPIFVLVHCPVGRRSGPFFESILAGDGEIGNLLRQCVTLSVSDAAQVDPARMNIGDLQDPDQTWWCWALSPQREFLSVFGPGNPDAPSPGPSEFTAWLGRVLDHYYDPRHVDWREDALSPRSELPESGTLAQTSALSRWWKKAGPLGHLRTQETCICCHQARDALWMADPRFNRRLDWWIWPGESALGIEFRDDESLTIAAITAESPAASAGLLPGDRIGGVQHSGKFTEWPLFGRTDFRAVVHNLPWEECKMTLAVVRDGRLTEIQVDVQDPNWRHYDVIWRKSLFESVFASHPGFLPTQAPPKLRMKLGMSETEGMAVVPKIGPASPNFRRGVTPATVIVRLGYVAENLTNEHFLSMFNILASPGDQIPVTLIDTRTGAREELRILALSIFDIPRAP